jgi:hypothetical protein
LYCFSNIVFCFSKCDLNVSNRLSSVLFIFRALVSFSVCPATSGIPAHLLFI